MANILGWVIGIGLIVLVNMISVPIHDSLESRARPPEAKTPRTAPYPIEVYYNAEVASAGLESADDGLWHYSWRMTSKSPVSAVAAFYREKYPKAEYDGDENYVEMAWTPEGAKEDEHVSLTILSAEAAEAEATTLEIDEFKQGSAAGFVPSLFMIRLAMWGLLLAALTLGQRPLAQLLGRVFVRAHAARGGSNVQRLEGPADPAALATWRAPEATLEHSGFRHLFDCTVTNAGFPNSGRILDRDGTTQALLQYAVVNRKPYTYLEMQTHFQDGSSVTTSTSKYSGTLKRPDRHLLVQLPEGTPPQEILRRHDEAVAARQAAGRAVASVEPEGLAETWKRIEQECLSGLEGVAPLTKEGLDVVTARPDSAPPVAAPEEAPPMAAPVPPTADEKSAFGDEVTQRLQALNPNLLVSRKDVTTLIVRTGNHQQDLDLETLYFMCRNNPADKDKILAGFLGRFAPKG